MGTKTAETVKDGRRTVVWESDFPVSFFNVIAGRWQVERGEGTAVYHYRGHPYNIGEMRGARRGSPLLFRVVLPLSLARAEAQRVPQSRFICPGISHEHYVLGGNRLSDFKHCP